MYGRWRNTSGAWQWQQHVSRVRKMPVRSKTITVLSNASAHKPHSLDLDTPVVPPLPTPTICTKIPPPRTNPPHSHAPRPRLLPKLPINSVIPPVATPTSARNSVSNTPASTSVESRSFHSFNRAYTCLQVCSAIFTTTVESIEPERLCAVLRYVFYSSASRDAALVREYLEA